MNYLDIIAYFQSDEKIAELLLKLKEDCFDVIEEIRQQYQAGILDNPDEMIQTKKQLSGIISNLEPIYSKALSLKKQEEYKYFVDHKESGSAAAIEKGAKSFVKNYRDVRDLLKGYLNSANALYYDIRDTLDRLPKQYNRETTNE